MVFLVDARAQEIVVYGGTPGGIAAAIAGARAGREVCLVEPSTCIGGLLTNGLSYSDFRTFEGLSGFFLEFATRVDADYRSRFGADSPQVKAAWRGTHGEPSVNLRILETWLAENPRVRVLRQHTLRQAKMSEYRLGRRRIEALVLATPNGAPQEIAAGVFIDATYEGDLMAMAGENFHVGRESRSHYGEPMAGDENGQADGQVQGYNFRFVMTQKESNRLPPLAPAGYKRDDFTAILPVLAAGRVKHVFGPGHAAIFRAHHPLLPNEKADVNDAPGAPVRLSLPGSNDRWPTGDEPTRRAIFDDHLYFQAGLLYFLQNDPDVPAGVQSEARSWGWCKDEFQENGSLPLQLYVREARRMVGQHVFTGRDTVTAAKDARAVLHWDSIAVGDYIHNCHGTARKGTRFDGEHAGQFFFRVQPYQIPYGVIVPQNTENLLVPVACSASHFGFSALRLEPIWSSLGQAAGWAADLVLRTKGAVQSVPVKRLQAALHADRSATIYVADVAPESDDFAAVQWWGGLGAFHGLVAVDQPRQPKLIEGQYYDAFPDHAAQLSTPLTPELRARWEKIISNPLSPADLITTRREFIRAAHKAANLP